MPTMMGSTLGWGVVVTIPSDRLWSTVVDLVTYIVLLVNTSTILKMRIAMIADIIIREAKPPQVWVTSALCLTLQKRKCGNRLID